jgi:hypothetical protein
VLRVLQYRYLSGLDVKLLVLEPLQIIRNYGFWTNSVDRRIPPVPQHLNRILNQSTGPDGAVGLRRVLGLRRLSDHNRGVLWGHVRWHVHHEHSHVSLLEVQGRLHLFQQCLCRREQILIRYRLSLIQRDSIR